MNYKTKKKINPHKLKKVSSKKKIILNPNSFIFATQTISMHYAM